MTKEWLTRQKRKKGPEDDGTIADPIFSFPFSLSPSDPVSKVMRPCHWQAVLLGGRYPASKQLVR